MSDQTEAAPSKRMLPIYIEPGDCKQMPFVIPIKQTVKPNTAALTKQIIKHFPVHNNRPDAIQMIETYIKRQLDQTVATIGVFRDLPTLDLTSNEAQIVQIHLEVQMTETDIFFDSVKWDLRNSNAMIDLYSASVVSDLGLPVEAAKRITKCFQDNVRIARERVEAGKLKPMSQPEADKIVKPKKIVLPTIVPKSRMELLRAAQAEKLATSKGGEGSQATINTVSTTDVEMTDAS